MISRGRRKVGRILKMVYSALKSEFVQCIVYRSELHESFSNYNPDIEEMTSLRMMSIVKSFSSQALAVGMSRIRL